MDMELDGKVAVVTGGSLGIGKAVARELAKEGARVVICARRPGLLQDAASELEQETGSKVLAVTADTTKADQVTNLFDVTMSRLGRVDILVNNAAVVGGLLQGALGRILGRAPIGRPGYQGGGLLSHRPGSGAPHEEARLGSDSKYRRDVGALCRGDQRRPKRGRCPPDQDLVRSTGSLRHHGQHGPPRHCSHGTDRLRLRSRGRRQGHP